MSTPEFAHAAYDPDLSHLLLVAVLVKLGGSIELGPDDFALDALGDARGVFYRTALDPLGDGRSRLSVHPAAPAAPDPEKD